MDKKRKILFVFGISINIISLLLLAGYLIYPYIAPEPEPIIDSSSVVSSEPEPVLVDNPIDFSALKERNEDVYAWIRIPDTKVDYPILQSGDKPENYYLNHNIDGEYEFAGCIYTQKLNSKDFSDPNTVIYGHNMKNGTMFKALHKFRNKDFFEANKYIYIYTPGHILTYEIYAAYKFDNRHLLYSYNYDDKEVFKEYVEMTKNPKSTIVNVRSETQVTENDKIITLSTCINDDNYRYLVQGVLIDDTLTK
ncbi:MAG: class B sortase [Acutalibacteraceae bacterium]|nr:class B sortase [Acutalibacteraceae bacterium]